MPETPVSYKKTPETKREEKRKNKKKGNEKVSWYHHALEVLQPT